MRFLLSSLFEKAFRVGYSHLEKAFGVEYSNCDEEHARRVIVGCFAFDEAEPVG